MEDTHRIIFRNIFNGVGKHGHFLRAFAETLMYADIENYDLLTPVAIKLIVKYKLNVKPYTETS